MTRVLGVISAQTLKNKFVGYFNNNKIFTLVDIFASSPSVFQGSFWTGGSPQGASNKGVAGYAMGGDNSAPYTGIKKVAFNTEISSSLAATLTTGMAYGAGITNNGTAGYSVQGLTSTYARGATANKLTYSNETIASITSKPLSMAYNMAWSNSGTAGYSVGGFAGGGVYSTAVYKLTYSTDTWTTTTSLGTGRQYPTCISNQGTAGYVAAGQNASSTRVDSIEKMVFSSDTRSTLAAVLSATVYAGGGVSLTGSHGYFSGGSNSANTAETNRNQKMTYSNDTITTLANLASTFWYTYNAIENW